jgi:hypothetical protein
MLNLLNTKLNFAYNYIQEKYNDSNNLKNNENLDLYYLKNEVFIKELNYNIEIKAIEKWLLDEFKNVNGLPLYKIMNEYKNDYTNRYFFEPLIKYIIKNNWFKNNISLRIYIANNIEYFSLPLVKELIKYISPEFILNGRQSNINKELFNYIIYYHNYITNIVDEEKQYMTFKSLFRYMYMIISENNNISKIFNNKIFAYKQSNVLNNEEIIKSTIKDLSLYNNIDSNHMLLLLLLKCKSIYYKTTDTRANKSFIEYCDKVIIDYQDILSFNHITFLIIYFIKNSNNIIQNILSKKLTKEHLIYMFILYPKNTIRKLIKNNLYYEVENFINSKNNSSLKKLDNNLSKIDIIKLIINGPYDVIELINNLFHQLDSELISYLILKSNIKIIVDLIDKLKNKLEVKHIDLILMKYELDSINILISDFVDKLNENHITFIILNIKYEWLEKFLSQVKNKLNSNHITYIITRIYSDRLKLIEQYYYLIYDKIESNHIYKLIACEAFKSKTVYEKFKDKLSPKHLLYLDLQSNIKS